MICCVRLMRKEDVVQVTEIDREAFPNELPSPNYYRELKNLLAHYVVAFDKEKMIEEPKAKAIPSKGLAGLAFRLKRFLSGNFGDAHPASGKQYILGFAGLWIMAEEAHITNIAMRESYRRQGIGELLLISLIELAKEFNARLVTLEVRASNTVAQNLYAKYGFVQVGIRQGYYIDNGEDGIIMTLDNVTSTAVQESLRQLKEAHSQKWGIAAYQIEH